MPPSECFPLFRITVIDASETAIDDSVVVAIEPNAGGASGQPAGCDLWLPELAPTPGLRKAYRDQAIDRREFDRRYSCQLREHPGPCQRLRALANERGIALRCDTSNPRSSVVSVLADHVERLECEHRWKEGLMVGGFLFPVRDEVVKAGGLYFARHKAWMMPNRQAWQYIQSLLPGDF